MLAFWLWYLTIGLLGLAAFPIAYRLFEKLPSRGYPLARSLGWLGWGYGFWILGSLGVTRNDSAGALFALALLLACSGTLVYRTGWQEILGWLRGQKGLILMTELLFLAAFGAWTFVRAANPEITATEKPMELAFLNSALRSPQIPPNDPWLSGYAISYYYFGYILVGLIARVTATTAGVAFNLGIALVLGLAACGAYSIGYDLLRGGRRREIPEETQAPEGRGSHGWALLSPLFVLLIGNLEGFLDSLHARGFFWIVQVDGSLTSKFWSWLNLKDLVNPPLPPFSWMPDRYLWWWRASRVINDISFKGSQQEVIDEFPFFSFLLADLHPHVLAIPFVLLAIAVGLNVYLGGGRGSFRLGRLVLPFRPVVLLAMGIILGGLAFLNTWDFPIYVGLVALAAGLSRVAEDGWKWRRLADFFGAALALGSIGAILYLPFYFGFASQAGGLLPNLVNPTRGAHLWVMFGGLLAPIYLLLVLSRPAWRDLRRGLTQALGFTLLLWVSVTGSALIVARFPELSSAALNAFEAPDAQSLLAESLRRRLEAVGGLATVVGLIGLSAAWLGRSSADRQSADRDSPPGYVLLLVLLGALLVLTPEFFYLRDLFGTRMNTIFKFYYQGWILWALAAAYASARILAQMKRWTWAIAGVLVLAFTVAGLVYPVMSLNTKTGGFDPPGGFVLDGTLHGAYLSQTDRQAVAFLMSASPGTLVEAVGGSYSSGGRISVHTGLPAVLGWVFHEGQWRGGYEEVGSRESDIERIYRTSNWEETRELLERYGVRYVYIGSLERTTYPVYESKFRQHLQIVFEQAEVIIYEYSPDGP